ncbi:MAG TPA: GWxTD domain-containing protein [Bacteroidia bacterium]|jgi:GWxTD domain-containing protein|nr:GWxTD domain-containing protein [Bacteroidia bacterium]
MKKLFCCVIIMIAGGFNLYSNVSASQSITLRPGGVKAYFNYAVFSAPDKGTYIETYLTIPGMSLLFKKQKNSFMATAHIEMSFSQDGKFVKGNAYNLNSPEILDTSNKPVLVDRQRYWIKPGKYEFVLKIKDMNRPASEALSASQIIEITAPPEKEVSFSGVELLESYVKTEAIDVTSKSGYDMMPYVLRYYPESVNKLAFYTEAYNALKKLGTDSRFLFAYFIEGAETKEKVTGMYSYIKQNSAAVNPLMGQFDISQLPTGEYHLVIEVRNAANELVAEKKLPFTRIAATVKIKMADINTIDTTGTFISQVVNMDTLKDYIACLWPISSTTERDWQYSQIKNADAKLMQQYIYAFWINRDLKNPELAWKKYRSEAVKVKKEYACGKQPGYMTDRGRVYLQYGAPSAAQQQAAEPDSYPYEIWQYYRLKDPTTGMFQSNKKFVFYNRELDGSCYQLLHSDARGEVRKDNWQIILKQRTNQIMNLDETTPTKSYGSGADDLFQNPR